MSFRTVYNADFTESPFPPVVEAEYSVSLQQDLCAYDTYQKTYETWKRVLWMVLIAAGIAMNIYAYVNSDYSNTNCLVFCAILIIMAGVIIARPISVRRNIEKAASELTDERYRMQLYKDYIKITTVYTDEQMAKFIEEDPEYTKEDIPVTFIHLDNNEVKVIEKDDMYAVLIYRSNVYAIPKSALDGDKKAKADEVFTALQDRFRPLKTK